MSVQISGSVFKDLKNLKEKLQHLKSNDVLVGIPTSENEPIDDTNLATIAATLEYGSAKKGIPSRPFLRKTLAEGKSEYAKFYKQCVGTDEPADFALKKLAKKAQADVQEKIRSGGWKPNSQKTIDLKGSSRPLIDTGRLRQSIRGIVRKKGAL